MGFNNEEINEAIVDEDMEGLLVTLDPDLVKEWLESPREKAADLESYIDPNDVFVRLDHLDGTMALLETIMDEEIEEELNQVENATLREQWQKLLEPLLEMTSDELEALYNKLDRLDADFERRAIELSELEPNAILQQYQDRIGYIVGLFSYYSPMIYENDPLNWEHVRALFEWISQDETYPQVIRDFCREELEELALYSEYIEGEEEE